MFYCVYTLIKQKVSYWYIPEAWGVYLNELLRRISTSMVGLYIPLYIFKETNQLLFIPLYYAIYSLMALIADYPAALVIKKIGVDKGMALGSLFRACFLYSLIFASSNHTFFWISAICFGLTQPFDWLPHHYVLAKMSQVGRRFSSTASISKIVTRIGSTLGPIMGGFIIMWFGFNTLYTIAGFLILIAALTPFCDKFEKTGMHVSGKEIWQRLRDRGMAKHLLVIGLENMESMISAMIWPVFLYTAMGSFEKTGSLETLSLLIGIGALYFAGKLVKSKKYQIMFFGTILMILGWVGRILGNNYIFLTTSNIVYFFGTSMYWIPISSLFYAHSVTQKYTMQYWLVYHIIIHYFNLLTCLAVMIGIILGISLKQIITITLLVFSLNLFINYIYRDYIKKYG